MPQVPVSDKRVSERFTVELPVTMEGEESSTRDLSSTGILLKSVTAPELGAIVDLTLEYLMDGHDFNLVCKGEVVRVEPDGKGYNIAVRLTQPLFTDSE